MGGARGLARSAEVEKEKARRRPPLPGPSHPAPPARPRPAAFLLYAGAAVLLVREGITFSGDEPNYLLNTHSLLYDRDINLANNYAAKDYFHFYSQKADPRVQAGHVRPGRQEGAGLRLPHQPAGRLRPDGPLLRPRPGLRRQLRPDRDSQRQPDHLGVLLGLQIYLLARDLWKREGLAFGLWAVYAFSTPVLFYAVHLYPEIPIALFSIYIYRMVRSGRALKPLHLAFLGLLLGSFFWFGLKYNLIFWPLLAVAVFDLWKTQRPRAKILWLVGPALLGLVLFYFGVWTMYGTISPFAVYEGAISGEQAQAITKSFLDLPHSARVDTFLDYFLDQRDGLFLYAPFWIFALLGFVEMGRRARGELIRLLLIAGPFVLNYAFFTHRQGFCPQGRVLAPISWIGAIAVGYFLAYAGKPRLPLAVRPGRGRGGGDLGDSADSSPVSLSADDSRLHPAGRRSVHPFEQHPRLPAAAPAVVHQSRKPRLSPELCLGGAPGRYSSPPTWSSGARRRKPLSAGFHAGAAALLLGGALAMWTAFPRPALSASHTVDFPSGGRLGFYLEQAGSGVIPGPDGSLYLHFAKSYTIYFASREPLSSIELTYGSLKGSHRASMSLFDVPLLADRTDCGDEDAGFPAVGRLPDAGGVLVSAERFARAPDEGVDA